MRNYNIESDLKQEQFQTLKLVQGDRGNKIKINVYEDGQPVSLTGCSVTAKYKRADGEIINDGVIENIHDNSFDAVMDSSITKVAGTLKMLFTIEKDDVKVSTFLLLADVRESIGENTGSSGGNTGGGSGEVTIDLSNYYKKIETYSKNQIDARFKEKTNKISKKVHIDDYTEYSIDNDYTNSFIQAINDLGTGGGEILLGGKEYVVSNISLPSYVSLIGLGFSTVIKHKKDSDSELIKLQSDNVKFIKIKNLTLDGNRYSTSTNFDTLCLVTNDTPSYENATGDVMFEVSNIYIKNSSKNALVIQGRGENIFKNIKIMYPSSNGVVSRTYDSWFENISVGMAGENGFVINDIGQNRYINCKAWMSGENGVQDSGYGYKVSNCQGLSVLGCEAQGNKNDGFYILNTSNCNFNSLQCVDNGGSSVDGAGISLNKVSKCNIQAISFNLNPSNKYQKYGINLMESVMNNNMQIITQNSSINCYKDINNSIPLNSFQIRGENRLNSVSFDNLMVGSGNVSTVAKLYVKPEDTNTYGEYIRRVTSGTGNKNLVRLESSSTADSSSCFLEVLINTTDKQVIMYSDGEILFNSNLKVIDSSWNGKHFIMGNYHFWVDSSGQLRIKNGKPTSDTDGEIVGQ